MISFVDSVTASSSLGSWISHVVELLWQMYLNGDPACLEKLLKSFSLQTGQSLGLNLRDDERRDSGFQSHWNRGCRMVVPLKFCCHQSNRTCLYSGLWFLSRSRLRINDWRVVVVAGLAVDLIAGWSRAPVWALLERWSEPRHWSGR